MKLCSLFLQVVIREIQESFPIIHLDGMTSFADVVSDIALDNCLADGRRRFGTQPFLSEQAILFNGNL